MAKHVDSVLENRYSEIYDKFFSDLSHHYYVVECTKEAQNKRLAELEVRVEKLEKGRVSKEEMDLLSKDLQT